MSSDVSDLFIFNSATKQPSAERLTPYKLTVVAFLEEYRREKSAQACEVLTDEEKWDFMILVLDLAQSPDMDLRSLRAIVDPVVNSCILRGVYSFLSCVARSGIKFLNDFFRTTNMLVASFDHNDELVGMIKRDSFMGIYVRRMILAYEQMSFSEVVNMCHKVNRWYAQGFPEQEIKPYCFVDTVPYLKTAQSIALLEHKPESDSNQGNFFSKKQNEYFISTQVQMISHHEDKALPPDELQNRLTSLLSDNPDLAEAHFLSYINSLRIKEYCTAVHSLYHYFDRKANMSTEATQCKKKNGPPDEVVMRYAALNLASLQFRFGNKDECRAVLKEAIRMAQESNDQVCLQHALVWLNLLGENHTGVTQLERSLKKTIDLSLPKLAVLGLHWISKKLGMGTEKPARVIDYFTQTNLINCLHSNCSMVCVGCVQRAALWQYYGKRELSSLDNQIVLNLNTSENGVYYNGQAVCIALCNLAQHHADSGEYSAAYEILGYARLRFPYNTQHCEVWQSCQQRITFTRALNNRNFSEAEQCLVDLMAIDESEAKIKKPLLLKEKGLVSEAFVCLNALLVECDKEKSAYYADFRCRVLLDIAALYICTGNSSSAVIHITDCISHAKKHFLELYEALASAYLALVQMRMNMPEQGIQLIESHLTHILSNASVLDKGKVLYIYAKCKVAATKLDHCSENIKKSAISLVSTVISLFKQAEAYMLEKDALYFQAMLYNSIGNTESRNKCAYQFKQLDKLYPTLCSVAVSTI